ncbi:dTDP-4-dehydrorhamnose 3,5-epimerase [Myxococcota bacterium]|nr:dTDP-4-dehydrorhamnose 3,5-epimerase [Myxococcota bacterium]MBU1381417.1 dTDP-4-dehydrorhamnose 3,5-epimerase [Myxococcota bacterium]MBU1498894.1 dTDP-4-dehydrorhamnose 3,5-epimerase [Myxococcota bacterium]
MNIISTTIDGVYVIETRTITDNRGSFARLFCENELAEIIGSRQIVQINYSRTSSSGAIRGLHFQYPPHSEMKLIRCIKGGVWDVALDLRADSPTFLRYHAQELTPENFNMLVIPEGCAHGFQVLKEDSELLYLHTEFYTPSSEGGVLYNDPLVSINWPLPVQDISERDKKHSPLSVEFAGITI